MDADFQFLFTLSTYTFFICNLASFFIYWALPPAASKYRFLRFFLKISVTLVMSQILIFIITFWDEEVNVMGER